MLRQKARECLVRGSVSLDVQEGVCHARGKRVSFVLFFSRLLPELQSSEEVSGIASLTPGAARAIQK